MTVLAHPALAHQAILHALPFVVPAFLVVGLVVAIIYRDRRAERREDESS